MLIYILPGITLLLFFINLFYKGNTVESCLLFIMTLLPLMNLKITTEAYGGFRIFDIITLYAFVFLFKDFISVSLEGIKGNYFLIFVILSIIILIGGLASEFPGRAYLSTLKVMPIFIFSRFFLIAYTKDSEFSAKAIKALKTAYLMALVFLLIQVIVGLKFTFYPVLGPNTIDPVFQIIRYPGIFYDSQAHGQYLIMGCFLFLFTQPRDNAREIVINYAICVAGLASALIAGSRSALGGFFVGLVVMLLIGNRRFRLYGIIAILLGFVVLKVAAPETAVFQRSKDLSQDYEFRKDLWISALRISNEHPLLGIGTDNYQTYVKRHAQNQYLEIDAGEYLYFDQPESGYLKLLVEWGYIGFVLFMLFLLIPITTGTFNRLARGSNFRNSIFIASLASWMVAFTTVYSIADYRIMIMVACMLVLIITSYSSNQIVPEDE